MPRNGWTTSSIPYCVECGRFKPSHETTPWMNHPVDFGWWCGCEPQDAQVTPEWFGRIALGTCGLHGPHAEPTCPGCDRV